MTLYEVYLLTLGLLFGASITWLIAYRAAQKHTREVAGARLDDYADRIEGIATNLVVGKMDAERTANRLSLQVRFMRSQAQALYANSDWWIVSDELRTWAALAYREDRNESDV